ncbi:hypothetical protein NSU_4540 [Novosphingobium pentaromativorans US6-1]|uniref:Uncharacterized protein n=1 Tax=Novosphingobium pentaromativorans US6-1 TaxID=1088721 RepID=G6EJL9_9SPHN|nr:hypothetical protein NSU_4540 [Novosphingobium pentaromativorans US6-1]
MKGQRPRRLPRDAEPLFGFLPYDAMMAMFAWNDAADDPAELRRDPREQAY